MSKKNRGLTHWTDAVGYYVSEPFPDRDHLLQRERKVSEPRRLYSDQEMLDVLDALPLEYGRWLVYHSRTGRGWRLAQTSKPGGSLTAREAIARFIADGLAPSATKREEE